MKKKHCVAIMLHCLYTVSLHRFRLDKINYTYLSEKLLSKDKKNIIYKKIVISISKRQNYYGNFLYIDVLIARYTRESITDQFKLDARL